MEEHKHTGTDQPQIDPKDLMGFPIYTSVPSHIAPEGTIVLYSNKVDTFKIYVRINNTWKSVAII